MAVKTPDHGDSYKGKRFVGACLPSKGLVRYPHGGEHVALK